MVVFPRQTLFEQSNDVTQLQVSGHEVLGWWVVAREDSGGWAGFPTRKMMEGYTELCLHYTCHHHHHHHHHHHQQHHVLHLEFRKHENWGSPSPGSARRKRLNPSWSTKLQEHDLTGAAAESLVRGAQLPKVLQQKVLKAQHRWLVVGDGSTIGGLVGKKKWRF